MIEKKFAPNINLFERIQPTKLDTGISYDMQPMRLNRMEKLETNDFKAVFSGLIENFNQELNAPDQLMKDVMQGSNSVDVHDVMTAMSKAEIGVSVATAFTTKIIQAYDRIMQIQL
jgi:flagellar hook-basal body complex protein FliE